MKSRESMERLINYFNLYIEQICIRKNTGYTHLLQKKIKACFRLKDPGGKVLKCKSQTIPIKRL
jgi:hypothetical protein